MRVAITYDSLRGTTKAAAHAMARRFTDAGAECTVASLEEADPADVAAADLVCVGSWTRGLFVVGQHPTPAALAFVDRLGDLAGTQCMAFCTYKLAAGPTLDKMASRLRARGGEVVAELEFRGAEPTHAFDSFARRVVAQNGETEAAPRYVSEHAETPFARARRAFIRTTDATRVQSPSRSRSLYRVWSRIYERSVHLDPAYQRGLNRMIALTVRRGDRTLDIGCGTGLGTRAAASRAREVVALDPSPEMIGRLEAHLRADRRMNVKTVLGLFPDALNEDTPFDSVISSFMMAHVPPRDRGSMYRKMYKQLGDGGRLGLYTARGEIARRFATIDQTVRHLEDAGFRSICVRELDDVYRILTAEV